MMDVVESMMKTTAKKEGELRMLPIIHFVEESTSYNRGKGQKSQSMVTVMNDVPDEDVDIALQAKELESPNIVIFLEDQKKLKGIFAERTIAPLTAKRRVWSMVS
ncbi:uncharacterized protein [Ptychodera flava]|uniref:uncharacterized protein n=1 Tax=Ptychodera flava TaxID=63121 RepID=UPI003969C593